MPTYPIPLPPSLEDRAEVERGLAFLFSSAQRPPTLGTPTMRRKDIDTIVNVIIHSGIATTTQRLAIAQRIVDWFEEQKHQPKECGS
jgi:hypothetical protein